MTLNQIRPIVVQMGQGSPLESFMLGPEGAIHEASLALNPHARVVSLGFYFFGRHRDVGRVAGFASFDDSDRCQVQVWKERRREGRVYSAWCRPTEAMSSALRQLEACA